MFVETIYRVAGKVFSDRDEAQLYSSLESEVDKIFEHFLEVWGNKGSFDQWTPEEMRELLHDILFQSEKIKCYPKAGK